MEYWPILDPHSVVCYLVEKAGLKIPDAALQEYWSFNAEHGEPWAQGVSPDRWPIGLYGDGARVNTTFGSENCIGVFLNFILWKPRSIRCSRFLLFAMPEHQLWKHYTMNVVLRRIVWSVNCLIAGQHPRLGPYQEELPAHLKARAGQQMAIRCWVSELRGDWSWHKKLWRFEKTSWTGTQVCHWCPALAKSRDPKELYWSLKNNTWEANIFSREKFITDRMPSRDMCS